MNSNEPIKIGRINRSSIRALKISLTGELSIYMSAKELDAIAVKRPHDYLSVIEELSHIVREPDYVAFQKRPERLIYGKTFFRDGAFQNVYLSIGRGQTPGKWYYEGMVSGGKVSVPHQFASMRFVRPQAKPIPQKNERS